MPLVQVVVTLIVVGVLLWLEETYLPIAAPIKNVIRIVVVVAIVLWLLAVFGIWDYASAIRVGPR